MGSYSSGAECVPAVQPEHGITPPCCQSTCWGQCWSPCSELCWAWILHWACTARTAHMGLHSTHRHAQQHRHAGCMVLQCVSIMLAYAFSHGSSAVCLRAGRSATMQVRTVFQGTVSHAGLGHGSSSVCLRVEHPDMAHVGR